MKKLIRVLTVVLLFATTLSVAAAEPMQEGPPSCPPAVCG